jgi:hypothetical protein
MKAKEMREKHYTTSWVNIFSIIMFFVSFFTAYFVSGNELSNAFVKSCYVIFVANVLSRILVFVWNLAIPKEQWLLIAHGPPEVESRSIRMQKERVDLTQTVAEETIDDMVMG